MRERVLERPAVGAIGIEADRQVLHHGQDGRCARELSIELVLHPLVEADPIGSRVIPGGATDRRGIGVPRTGPASSATRPESLGERAEDRVLPEHVALFGDEALEVGIRVLARPAPTAFRVRSSSA